ncbi:MAG: PPK2 family polyphosphate kinase [Candidatus Gracilibacteria bacterium]
MSHIELSKLNTRAPDNVDRNEIEAEFEQIREEIIELQQKFYADGRHSLLIVLQGMDASGKDGTVRHVFYGVNPLGIRVYPYGKPTDEEAKHDFLWRLHVNTPKKGMISIFNRSYYEDILVPTVEGYIEKDIIERRYDHINNFEEMLRDNGTIVLKFFLHMSKDMQRERLDERMEERKKNWKHHASDEVVRKKWEDYMEVYEDVFKKTNTKHAPWHIIPTDDKWYKVYLVAKTIRDTLKDLDLEWPELSDAV